MPALVLGGHPVRRSDWLEKVDIPCMGYIRICHFEGVNPTFRQAGFPLNFAAGMTGREAYLEVKRLF